MNRTWTWQYMRRETGGTFGSPRRLSLAEVERQMAKWPVLVAFNTETGEVVYR